MKKVFISWSKKKSGEYAKIVKHTIQKLVPENHVFMSEEDIQAGEFVQNKIIKSIEECDILILCFTNENKKSPWLLYEAGYASGLHKIVVPFLFDSDSMVCVFLEVAKDLERKSFVIYIVGDVHEAVRICSGFRSS